MWTKNKEKVFVILSPGFPASKLDTSCLPMQQAFVRALSKLPTDVHVIVFSFHYPFTKTRYKWFDVPVMSFGGRNKGGVRGIRLRMRVERELDEIHREKEIVGLLSFWLGECAKVGERFAVKNGLRHFSWILGQDARQGNKYAGRLPGKGEQLIALSDFLQEEFETNYGIKPANVIYPGIENSYINNVPRGIDLLAVGSLIPLKRFEVFLEVVARIRKQMPLIKAVIVGDGPEAEKLKKVASNLCIDSSVDFMGSVSHSEVLGLMERTKILVHPSSYEGYSGVCQEALVCGAHVISFCRAVNAEVRQWHIASTKDEMVTRAITILQDETTQFEPVAFQSMDCSAQQVMNLYRE